MIRRILAGAAIAAVALGFSATGASADQPNPHNGGQAFLSQFQLADDALNGVGNQPLNESLRNITLDASRFANVYEVDLNVLNNQPQALVRTPDSNAWVGASGV